MGTVGPYRGLKRGQGVTLTIFPPQMLESTMSRIYISLATHGVAGQLYFKCVGTDSSEGGVRKFLADDRTPFEF
jgi:hypothetical protein